MFLRPGAAHLSSSQIVGLHLDLLMFRRPPSRLLIFRAFWVPPVSNQRRVQRSNFGTQKSQAENRLSNWLVNVICQKVPLGSM